VCGIAGIVRDAPSGVALASLERMAGALRHRGPDGYGFYVSPRAGLAHVRLSIIDIACGAQPMTTEGGALVITYNGEIYNYIELRAELEALGHRFRTRSDTEVLLHAWMAWGSAMFERLNGQFAFGLLDRRDGSLLLARDRFGVRPLFYAEHDGTLVFGSEAKALFASGEVPAAPDLLGLDEVFSFWAARAPRTVFAGVRQLEPGCWARWADGRLAVHRFSAFDYAEADVEPADALETLDGILRSSVALRMRADVPVGGYLSGGLDSSVTCALAAAASPFALRTFSVTFDDPRLDESAHQRLVAGQLRSVHAIQPIGQDEIGAVFPEVVRHAETPLVRTAPAPMYLLAKLTRGGDIKVVLTGEGSDELFLGYDLYKETLVRRFCLRRPGSAWRPRLFDRLYPYLAHERGGEMWRQFFLTAGEGDDPLFSHMPRILLTSRIKDFYSADVRAGLAGADVVQELREDLPPGFGRWSDLGRAAYLELHTLLAGYLLSSQGDRMAMAHGVEGRYPFLDPRLFAFLSRLPTRSLLRGLREKDLLRRWAKSVVPPGVLDRPKQPYRAPDVAAFFGRATPAYVDERLGEDAVRRAGLFDPAATAGLVRRCRSGKATGFRENQALVGLLSAQLWHQQFFAEAAVPPPLPAARADVVLRAADDPALEPATDGVKA
jgi:asparagine synthase (glutamine-hydrolysing)